MAIRDDIRALADRFAADLEARIEQRVTEMEHDDNSHFLIYRVLGVTSDDGRLIDIYQNKGRFLYRYAGAFLEEAAKLCFVDAFPGSGSVRIPNTTSQRPRTFEIDCLINDEIAIEIKWRDATTDGDHITKEHTRLQNTRRAGYRPVRIMFYYPNREQARRVQKTLETLYSGVEGEYYYGDDAWSYVRNSTGVDLLSILRAIADERTQT